jgi:hypothetical protein
MSTELMVAYALGECTPEEARRIETAAAASPAERRRLEQVRSMVLTLRTDESVEPPPDLVRKAKSLLTVPSTGLSLAEWLAGVDRVIATLVFDSRAPGMLAGFRSGASTDFHMTFHTDLAEVDLEIRPPEPPETSWTLRGQVDPQQPVAATDVGLVSGSDVETQTVADDRGRFMLRASPGRYDLIVRLGDRCVSVQEIVLG